MASGGGLKSGGNKDLEGVVLDSYKRHDNNSAANRPGGGLRIVASIG